MANNTTKKRIQYDIGFNTDTKQLDEVKKQLQEIQKLTNTKFKQNGIFDTSEMQQVRTIAKEVEQILNNAYNPKINSVNVTKFNTELAKTGLNARTLYEQLSKAGPAGTQAFSKISSAVMSTNKELKQTHNFLDNIATTLSNTIKWNAASSVVNTFAEKVSGAVTYVEKLDTSLNDIRIVTGQSAEEMDKFAIKANKAAGDLGKSTLDYTRAALTYYQQGLSDDEVQARTNVTLKASNVTGQDTADVAEQLTAVWNGFKVAAEDTEEYVDKLAAVGAATASDLEELSTGMAKVASGASSMGVNIDQLTASLATIVSTTRQDASSVGTALKTIYSRIADIEAGAEDAEATLGDYSGKMAELGFNVLDSDGKLRDLGEVIEEIGDDWSNLSRERQIYLAQTMAGTRQYNNLIALFDNWNEYQKALNVSQQASGTLQKQQNTYLESTTAHINQLNTALDSLYNSTLDSGTINSFADSLKLIVTLTDNWIQSIGGGKGALLNLGAVGLNVFNKQISEGISTAIHNMKVASNNAAELQAKMNWSNEIISNPDVYGKEQSQITSSQEKLISMQNILTQGEQEVAEGLTEEARAALEAKAAFDSKTKTTQNYISTISALNIDIDSASDSELSDLGMELTEIISIYDKMIEQFKANPISIKADNDIDVETQKVQSLTDALAKLKTMAVDGQLTAQQNDLILGKNNFEEQYKKAINEALNRQKNNNNSLFDTETPDSIFADEGNTALLAQADAEFAKYLKSMSNKLTDFVNKARSSVNDANEQVEQLIGGEVQTQLEENVKNSQSKLKTFWDSFVDEKKINGMVQLAGGLTSLGATISNVSNLFETLGDDSLSASEKATQAMTSIGTTAVSAISGISALKNGLSALGVAAAGPVTLGITAAVAAIGLGVAAFNYFSKAAENARNKVSDSVDSYKEATFNLESLNNELTTNKEKLEELLAIDASSRTTQQQEEITNLQTQNALLETKIELEKKLAHSARQETINNYEDAESSGAYNQDTTFKVENTSRDLLNHTDTLDATDDKAWSNYERTMQAMSLYYQNPAAGNDANFAKILDERLEAAKDAREAALEKIQSFNVENLETWQETVQAYIDEGKEIPESLSTHIKEAMESAGTYESTSNGLVQQIVGENEELWDSLIEKAKEKSNDQTWKDILPTDIFKQFENVIKETGLSVEDVLTDAIGDGSQSLDEFNQKTEESIEKLNKEIKVTDSVIESLDDYIAKIESKGADSLTDKELKSLEETETLLGKVSTKYGNLANLRKTNETEYIKLLKEGREELRKQQIAKAAQKVTSGDSAYTFSNDKSRGYSTGNATVAVDFSDKNFRKKMDELLDEKYELNVQINTDLKEATNEILNSYDVMQKAFNKIDKNLKVTGENVVDLMEAFPNLTDVILENSSRASDGSITFTKAGFEAFKTAATQEMQINAEKTKDKLQKQADEYQSEIEKTELAIKALDTYIEAVEQSGDDETNLKKAANEAIDTLNQEMYDNAKEYAVEADNSILDSQQQMLDQATESLGLSLKDQAYLWDSYAKDATASLQEISRGQQAVANNEEYTAKTPGVTGNYSHSQTTNPNNITADDIEKKGLSDDALSQIDDVASARITKEKLEEYLTSLKAARASLIGQISQIDSAGTALTDFSGKGGSTGSSSSAKITDIIDLLTDELDAYHDINIEIQTLENEMDMLQAKEKNLFGADLIQNYADQVSNVTEQFNAWQRKLEVNQKVIEHTKELLSKFNLKDKNGQTLTIKYDEKGQISNYNDILEALQESINQDATKYNNMTKAQQDSEKGKTLKQKIEQDKKTMSLAQQTMDSYNTALNETGPEAERQIETLKTQLNELYAELTNIDNYRTVLETKTRGSSQVLDELSSALDSVSSEIEDLTAISDGLLGEDFYNNISRAKVALTSQLIVAVAQTAKTFHDAKNKIEDTNTMMKNLKSTVEASKESLQALLDQMQAEGKEDTYGIGNIISSLNEINLDSGNIGDLIKGLIKIDQAGQAAQEAAGAMAEAGEAATTTAAVSETGTALSMGMAESALGYVGIAIMIAKAAYSLAKMINSYSEKMSEIRIAESNYDINEAIRADEYLSKWQSFRRIMEDLKKTDYLGKIKQDLRDIVENLSGLSFSGEGLDAFKAIDVQISSSESLINQLYEKVNGLNQSINDGSFKKTYSSGILFWKKDNLDKAIADLDTYNEKFMDKIEEIQNLFTSAEETFVESWSNFGDQLNKQVTRYETITSSIEHNKNMMTLLYGDDAYSKLTDWYNLETQVNESRLSYQQQQVEFWEKQMSALEEGSEAWQEAESQYQSSLDSFNSALESAVQNIIDKYSNAVNEIFANMTNQLTNGSGLTWLNDQMNLINKYSDHYLDGVNSTYQIVSLQNKFMDAINNAEGNVTAQERIKKLMDEQLSDLKSRDKLTKYDVERAEKLLEIETARQALKDAQNNNSKMRLTRDSQGNYSYTYIADEDAINETQQKLSDAQNDLYNFDKDQYQQNLSEMYSVYEEYINKMKEIATNQSLDDEERQRQMADITQKYQEYITGIAQDNTIIRDNLSQSTFDSYLANAETARDTASSDYQQFIDYLTAAGVTVNEQTGKMTIDWSSMSDANKQKLEEFGLSFDAVTGDLKINWSSMTEENKIKFDNFMNSANELWSSDMQQMIGRINTDEDSFMNKSSEALNKIIDLQKEYNALIDKLKTSLGGLDFTKGTTELNKWKNYATDISSENDKIIQKYKNEAEEIIKMNESLEETKKKWQDIYETKYKAAALDSNKTSTTTNTTPEKKSILKPWTWFDSSKKGWKLWDTGGYTGDWSHDTKDGKIGILHQKELVLNKEDTKNILAAVDTVRSISDSLRGQALETANSYTSDLDNIPQTIVQPVTQSVQQEVHIDATFPNVTDHNEVELALNNLVNTASQKIAENKVENGNVGKLST